MKLYMYAFCSLDYNWDRLPTVKDFIKDNFYKDQLLYFGQGKLDGDFYKNLHLSISEASHIAYTLKRCLEYAEEHLCWDNTFSEQPRIFFIPGANESYGFPFGFAWKIHNNGTAYIASPIELPGIDEFYGCDQGILDFSAADRVATTEPST